MLSIFRDYHIPPAFKTFCTATLNLGIFAAVTKSLFDLNVGAGVSTYLHSSLDNRQVSLLTAGALAGLALVVLHNSKRREIALLREKIGSLEKLNESLQIPVDVRRKQIFSKENQLAVIRQRNEEARLAYERTHQNDSGSENGSISEEETYWIHQDDLSWVDSLVS